MPEACPVCEARREQTRLRVKRYRERRNAAPIYEGNVTASQAGHVTPSPPAPPLPALSTTERLLERLAPFANRAFKPDPAFLALLAERYPAVDLELELAAALDWLEEPRHAKRRCSKGFLANWVKKADADRKARELGPATRLPPGTLVGHSRFPGLVRPDGTYVPPAALQSNRQPGAPRLLQGDLQPIRREDFSQYQAERRKLTPEQRMAQWKGAGK